MRLLSLTLSCLLISSSVFAIFCPSNFTAINYGDTLDQVLAQCGKPAEMKQYISNGNTAQQWSYFVKPNGYENLTVKMTVLFSNNQVANITLDNENQGANTLCQESGAPDAIKQLVCNTQPTVQSLSSTPICGFTIKIGDTQQAVQNACGKPAIIQQVQVDDPNNSSQLSMAELIYPGPPRVLLIFENGRLKDRQFI